eukprot:5909399-Amphidinium_carterae.1
MKQTKRAQDALVKCLVFRNKVRYHQARKRLQDARTYCQLENSCIMTAVLHEDKHEELKQMNRAIESVGGNVGLDGTKCATSNFWQAPLTQQPITKWQGVAQPST